MSAPAELSQKLSSLFDAERTVRRIHAELMEQAPNQLVSELRTAMNQIASADGSLDDDEVALRLVRMASLLSDMEGPESIDLLIDILGTEEPEGRHAAGSALEDLAYDRFKEVALGVERAIKRLPEGNPALAELPYLLAEIPEPGTVKLLERFLQHKDAEAVAASIESLVELGDPAVLTILAPLRGDNRTVVIESDEGEGDEDAAITIGELATEAMEILSDLIASTEGAKGRNGGGSGAGARKSSGSGGR